MRFVGSPTLLASCRAHPRPLRWRVLPLFAIPSTEAHESRSCAVASTSPAPMRVSRLRISAVRVPGPASGCVLPVSGPSARFTLSIARSRSRRISSVAELSIFPQGKIQNWFPHPPLLTLSPYVPSSRSATFAYIWPFLSPIHRWYEWMATALCALSSLFRPCSVAPSTLSGCVLRV